jgi:hypothetical protein
MSIAEASGKLPDDPDALLDLPQQQATAVAADRSTVKLSPNLALLLKMKSRDKLVTLCAHKAVAPSWRDFFPDKTVMP